MIIIYLVVFLIVYLFYLLTVVLQKKKMDKFKNSKQITFFVKRYKLDLNKIDMVKFTNLIGLANAFIIATTFVITFIVDELILILLLAVMILLPLTYIIYTLIGKYYIKKGCVINE